MSTQMNRTPYSEDALRVENGTQPEEIQEFVIRRAKNPYIIDDVIVWDFNNHMVNINALEKQVGDLLNTEYVIPYQASGAWAYMVSMLPKRIREAEILTYNQSEGEYKPYPNYFRHSDPAVNNGIRRRLADKIDEVQV